MNIRLELTLSSDELEIINFLIKFLKTKVFKLTLFPGGFALTSWDGTWPADLKAAIFAMNNKLEVDLVDGIKSPSFKRVIIDGFPKIFE